MSDKRSESICRTTAKTERSYFIKLKCELNKKANKAKIEAENRRRRLEDSAYLQYVRNDVFLALFEKRVFVKVRVGLQDLRQHL